jgi:hypothetical protein
VLFRPDAFDGQLGRRLPVHLDGLPTAVAQVVGVVVSPDGATVTLTLQIDDRVLGGEPVCWTMGVIGVPDDE